MPYRWLNDSVLPNEAHTFAVASHSAFFQDGVLAIHNQPIDRLSSHNWRTHKPGWPFPDHSPQSDRPVLYRYTMVQCSAAQLASVKAGLRTALTLVRQLVQLSPHQEWNIGGYSQSAINPTAQTPRGK